MPIKTFDDTHRRYNPLKDEWVLVSHKRNQRPWQGAYEDKPHRATLPHEPTCYLCAGNTRVQGDINPHYEHTFVFQNDFPSLTPHVQLESLSDETGLFQAESAAGECRVICFSNQHHLTLADMSIAEINQVIHLWVEQYHELSQHFRWIQIFENKGEVMGCSNPHPHGQIWASHHFPTEALKEDHNQKIYFEKCKQPMLLVYAESESSKKVRTVCENQDWIVVVPYWATWPYETLLLPKFKAMCLSDLSHLHQQHLAEILKTLLMRYDRLFQVSFPYSMGWHGTSGPHWQLHAHFYPPLLRSVSVKKFMVGYEMLAEPQRDLTPEQAAERLR